MVYVVFISVTKIGFGKENMNHYMHNWANVVWVLSYTIENDALTMTPQTTKKT